MVITRHKVWIICLYILSSWHVWAKTELEVHLKGVVMPAQQINFSFAQSGLLKHIVKNGHEISKGAVLAQLQSGKLQAELNKSKALLRAASSKLASAEHERNKSSRLVKENILSEIALVEANFAVTAAQEELTVAKSQLAIAQANLDDTVITAPFNGAVINAKTHQGEWINAGEPFISLINYQDLSLSIDIPPQMGEELALGQSTDVLLNKKQVGTAQVKTIFPIVDPASGLLRIVWQVTPNQGIKLSGRYVSLQTWFKQ